MLSSLLLIATRLDQMGTVIRLLAFISDMFTAIVLFWGSYITFISDAIIGIFVILLFLSQLRSFEFQALLSYFISEPEMSYPYMQAGSINTRFLTLILLKASKLLFVLFYIFLLVSICILEVSLMTCHKLNQCHSWSSIHVSDTQRHKLFDLLPTAENVC